MKKIIAILTIIFALLAVTACGNRDMFDTVYTYDYAIVSFPDDTVEKIKIKQWKDYEDGEQIQIATKDGTVYLVHADNCILVRESD